MHPSAFGWAHLELRLAFLLDEVHYAYPQQQGVRRNRRTDTASNLLVPLFFVLMELKIDLRGFGI